MSSPGALLKPKRNWNAFIWSGFAITLLAFLSYFLFFLRFPSTRDFPWLNLLLFLAGGRLLGVGLRRAFLDPVRYRGKVSGPVLGVLGLIVFGLFCYFTFALAKELPSANGAPREGQPAPDFTLPDANGKPVTLSGILKTNRAALLIFYRGSW